MDVNANRPNKSWQSAFQLVSRIATIVLVLVRNSAMYVFRAIWMHLTGAAMDARREVAGRMMCDILEQLGPAFIKFGQVLSSRPDLLPPQIIRPLTRLQNNVRPMSESDLSLSLERLEEACTRDAFSFICRDPLATGSIAQVHQAILKTGENVAVKLRRPGISETIHLDVAIVKWLAAAAERLTICRYMPLCAIASDVTAAVVQQVDFEIEADNNRRFRSNFRNRDLVVFPYLHEDLCSKDVLVMELMEDLRSVDRVPYNADECQTAALAGLRTLYKMIFDDGFVHADMHPGNLWFRAWGEIVILDFGLVTELDTKDRNDFVNFFFGLINDDGETCARIIWDNALSRPEMTGWNMFNEAIIALVSRYAQLRSSDFKITSFVFEIIELQRQHKILGSTKFVMTILSMIVFDGICKKLHPGCDFQKEARGYLVHARYRTLGENPPAIVV